VVKKEQGTLILSDCFDQLKRARYFCLTLDMKSTLTMRAILELRKV
jgi:hypothetical protein